MIRNDLILFREWMRNSRAIMQPYWSYMFLGKRPYVVWRTQCIEINSNLKVHVKFNIVNAAIDISARMGWWESSNSEVSVANPNIHKQLAYSINKISYDCLNKYIGPKKGLAESIQFNTILRNIEEYNANFKW